MCTQQKRPLTGLEEGRGVGVVRPQLRVSRICSIIAVDFEVLRQAAEMLQEEFGPKQYETHPISWNYSRQYRDEMGTSLKWMITSYQDLQWPEDIWRWKLVTNELEAEFAREDGTRRANLDPGYTDGVKVILASTKNYANRIYIKEGIYADFTLAFNYEKQSYEGHYYTFPEYKSPYALKAFNDIRKILLKRLHQEGRLRRA